MKAEQATRVHRHPSCCSNPEKAALASSPGDKLSPAVSRKTEVHLNFLLMWAAPASHELAVPDLDLQTSTRSEPQPPADSQSRNPLMN